MVEVSSNIDKSHVLTSILKFDSEYRITHRFMVFIFNNFQTKPKFTELGWHSLELESYTNDVTLHARKVELDPNLLEPSRFLQHHYPLKASRHVCPVTVVSKLNLQTDRLGLTLYYGILVCPMQLSHE